MAGKNKKKKYKSMDPLLRARVLTLADAAAAGRQVFVLHMQTTGLNPTGDKIVQICAVRCEPKRDGTLTAKEGICRWVKPERPMPENVMRMTGITDGMLAGAKGIAEVMPEVAMFLGARPVVISYNASGFDVPFLEAAGYKTGWMCRPCASLNIRNLTESVLPHRAGDPYSYRSIVQDLGWPAPAKGDAKADVLGYIQLWNALVPMLWEGRQVAEPLAAAVLADGRLHVRTSLGEVSWDTDGYWVPETKGADRLVDIDRLQVRILQAYGAADMGAVYIAVYGRAQAA